MTERTAQGSKIAAAGFGVTTMFGLVAAMGFASTNTSSAVTPPESVTVETMPPTQVVVVIHPADPPGNPGSDATAATAPGPGTPGVVTAVPSQPIVLTAQPTVRQAPASPAPVAQTNGSR